LPVVSCPYMPAAEMPIPCCPRLMRSRWNLDPYRSFAKMGGICCRMMPGPLSVTVMRKRLAWLGGGRASPLATGSALTTTSGRIPASSHASSALSAASLTQVSSALRGLSNPRRCRFLVKNSETEMSRWRAPISTAVTACFGSVAGGLVSEEFTFCFGSGAGGLVFDAFTFCFDFVARGLLFEGLTFCFGSGARGLLIEALSFRPRFANGFFDDTRIDASTKVRRRDHATPIRCRDHVKQFPG